MLQDGRCIPDVSNTSFWHVVLCYCNNTLDITRLWFMKPGHCPLITKEETRDRFLGSNKIMHRAIDNEDINNAIHNAMRKRLVEQGKVPFNSLIQKPCKSTKYNYKTYLVCLEEAFVKRFFVEKMVVQEIHLGFNLK